MYNVTNMFLRLKESVTQTYNGVKYVVGTFLNLRANGYNPEQIGILSPYGQGSIPVDNIKGLVLPIEGSNKLYYNIGFLVTVPPILHDFKKGESWSNSLNYTLMYQNDGIIAYKINDSNNYKATLPNGEWVGKLVQDRINEIEAMISEINANYTALLAAVNGHTHTYSPGPGSPTETGGPSSTLSQTPLPVPSTLAADTASITAEEYLINDHGILP